MWSCSLRGFGPVAGPLPRRVRRNSKETPHPQMGAASHVRGCNSSPPVRLSLTKTAFWVLAAGLVTCWCVGAALHLMAGRWH